MSTTTYAGQTRRLLASYRAGEEGAEAALFERLYGDLLRAARRRLAQEPAHATLVPTSLVHELYLRLDGARVEAQDRSAFLRVAARAMAQLLVDHGRRRRSSPGFEVCEEPAVEANPKGLELNDALARLQTWDRELARIVELRFLLGFSVEQTALELGASTATIKRGWRVARAFLARELGE